MVAGNADREGVEPRKVRDWDGPMVFMEPAGDSALCRMASARNRPGVLGRVEPYRETRWQPGRSGSRRWRGITHPSTSVRSEEEGRDSRKSEASIRAMKPGNAGGAKGCRFGRTGKGNMARHRAD